MIIAKNIRLLKKSEANKYYKRNMYYYNEGRDLPSFEKNKIEPGGSTDFIIDCFKTTKIKVNNILEIGCANGRKLEKYKAYFKSKKQYVNCYGIDLSSLAIKNGKKKYKNLKLFNYSSLQISKFKTKFDLIICGYFLYLLDREYLFKQFDLIFERLNTNGHLLIVDFDPLFPHHNKSGHNKKLNIYKMNLKNFIEASNLFKSIYLHKWEISNTFKKKFISSDISVALFQKINFERDFPKNL
jgi:SAM-dependent methyltransferase